MAGMIRQPFLVMYSAGMTLGTWKQQERANTSSNDCSFFSFEAMQEGDGTGHHESGYCREAWYVSRRWR